MRLALCGAGVLRLHQAFSSSFMHEFAPLSVEKSSGVFPSISPCFQE